jgi:hypothetical protein
MSDSRSVNFLSAYKEDGTGFVNRKPIVWNGSQPVIRSIAEDDVGRSVCLMKPNFDVISLKG